MDWNEIAAEIAEQGLRDRIALRGVEVLDGAGAVVALVTDGPYEFFEVAAKGPHAFVRTRSQLRAELRACMEAAP